jgi:RNA polymerase sigma-70 factor (ECF subfamily)
MRAPGRIRTILAVALVAGLLGASTTTASAPTPNHPVSYTFLSAITAGFTPGADPPGANDFSCQPSAEHPNPVVLVHQGWLASKRQPSPGLGDPREADKRSFIRRPRRHRRDRAWGRAREAMAIRPEQAQRLADEDLMPLIGGKDPDAFEVFYDRHGRAAFSLAYRVVGDRSIAEDVAQEAFLSIWRSGARYDRTRGSVRAWLLGIVRNRAIDALRREGGRAPRLRFDDEAILEQRPAPEHTEAQALLRETRAEVRGALSQLPSEQSEVIQLAFFGGFTHSEIAEMLGTPLGTVKGRMRLGMEKIRGELAEGFS